MKTISQKLRSNQGSSMLLAMLLVLVGLMVSHTVLSAAATAGRSVKGNGEVQQAYLTVSSAAETFRDAVLSLDGQYQETTKYLYDAYTGKLIRTEKTEGTLPKTTPFSAELKKAMQEAGQFDVPYTRTYRIEAEGYDPVEMKLTLEKDGQAVTGGKYVLSAVFSNVVSGNVPAHPCRMTVEIQAEQNASGTQYNPSGNLTERTLTWGFSKAVIKRTEGGSQ